MDQPMISPEYDTPLKQGIETVFLMLCSDVAFLRSYFTTGAPGAVYKGFRDFKEHFDLLYTMSCDKKDLNLNTVKKIKEWLNKDTRETKANVLTGIALFEEYKADLFKIKILTV